MKEKTIEIIAPEGYEVDKEKSSFEKIVFRALPENGLPKTYDALQNVRGYYVGSNCKIYRLFSPMTWQNSVHNTWPTLEEAEASIALAQLCQLRDRYNGGWAPSDDDKGYGISINRDGVCFGVRTLAFKTPDLRDKFEENFADLIEKAKPLLG